MQSAESGLRQKRPRILYLAFYYPPTRASGVYRSRATANHLVKKGCDVTVITPQREFFRDYIHSFDPTLESAIHPDVKVERVPFSGELWEPDIRRYSALRVYAPQLWRRLWNWRNLRTFPEAYSPWIAPALKRAHELHSVASFDVVIATGNPFAAFAIAWKFYRSTGVPYVIDYRDPWTLDLFTENPKYPDRHPVVKWERRVISEAAAILHVNEPLRRWHAERYPDSADRMTVVENGWDPDILANVAHTSGRPSGPLRFGYLGTLTPTTPLDEFIAGWALARKHPLMTGAVAKLYGYLGYFRPAARQLRTRISAANSLGVSYEGPVAKTEVGRVYQSVDVLILAIPNSRFMTSGKVYEYLATGSPIVSVHEPYCAASETLRGYPLWFPAASLAAGDVSAALVEAAEAARVLTPDMSAKARDFALGATRDAQLQSLDRELGAILRQPGAMERSGRGSIR